MLQQEKAATRIIRRKEVQARTGLSCSTIYARMNPNAQGYDPTFPAPIKLGNGTNPPVGWNESEVNAWINQRIESSRKAA